ncbi:MAG TPA: hypothetical protein VLU46_05765, partial [Thermoanaerobaculia bacterium]|nr:hypothetical protein [Thermoanaerobaculia bacterium]
MRRVIVLGGSGFFGGLIAERLRAAGVVPVIASRSTEVRIDANDAASIRANIKQRDVVVDAAGPFQKRNSALIDAARTVGFDLVDLSDSAEYTSMIYERETPIGAAGIRVLTACSALSTITAFAVKSSGIDQPEWVRSYLLPASRHTANPATIESFLAALDGTPRTFGFPRLGNRTGLRVRCVDAVTIPRAFPSVRVAEMYVDTGMTSANLMLRVPFLRPLLQKYRATLTKVARRGGHAEGALGFEIASTLRHKEVVFTGAKTYMLAALPAILAATAIANGRF